MMGEDLEETFVSTTGIPADRSFAFVDKIIENQRHPWMTARQKHEMLLFKPNIENSTALVESPEGERFDLKSKEFHDFLRKRFERDLVFKHDDAGIFDSHPLSLFSVQTAKTLSSEIGIDLQLERFRANLYTDWANDEPFYEDHLLGKELKLGEQITIRIEKKDSRCVIPTLDPVTSTCTPKILKHIKERHNGCVGVYATIARQGILRNNDPINLSE
jgi:uncharacterized protein YcbX